MLAWLFLLALLVAEALALRWWLNREYYPLLFNAWAVCLYVSVFAVDALLAWLFSFLLQPGGDEGLLTLAIVSIAATVIAALFTIFFRWIIRQDLPDMPPPEVGQQNDRRQQTDDRR